MQKRPPSFYKRDFKIKKGPVLWGPFEKNHKKGLTAAHACSAV